MNMNKQLSRSGSKSPGDQDSPQAKFLRKKERERKEVIYTIIIAMAVAVVGIGAFLHFSGTGAQKSKHAKIPPAAQEGLKQGDATVSDMPADLALIPAGKFQMGDAQDGASWLPVRMVDVSKFHIGKTEVTNSKWDAVCVWAISHNYTDLWSSGKDDHPVTVSWFDAAKWCNARSEMEGLTPCYFTDEAQATVYRTGRVGLTNKMVKWDANGYRLPTDAEWEKAARGGATGLRFPWGNTITHSQANYQSSGIYIKDNKIPDYDISPTRGDHPLYGGTSSAPVGSFPPNGYGLYDMVGNAWEWCWNWSSVASFKLPDDRDNPKGASKGQLRIRRGGAALHSAPCCCVAYPNSYSPEFGEGFRVVRR